MENKLEIEETFNENKFKTLRGRLVEVIVKTVIENINFNFFDKEEIKTNLMRNLDSNLNFSTQVILAESSDFLMGQIKFSNEKGELTLMDFHVLNTGTKFNEGFIS
jgi:hypothetical protein